MKLNSHSTKVSVRDIQNISVSVRKELALKNFIVTDNMKDLIIEEAHKVEFYALLYCLSGTYEVSINKHKFILNAGKILFFKPGEVHELEDFDQFKGIFIGFDQHFFPPEKSTGESIFFQPFFMNTQTNLVDLSLENKMETRFYFHAMARKALDITHPFLKNIIRGMLSSLLYDVTGMYQKIETIEENMTSRKNIIFKNFLAILDEHYMNERQVNFYANKLCITPNYLGEVIKDINNKSVIEFIKDKVIIESKILLRNSDESIGNIASNFNFSDVSSFIKYFKRSTGISPLKYRHNKE